MSSRNVSVSGTSLAMTTVEMRDAIAEAPRLRDGLGIWAVSSVIARSMLAGGRATKLKFHRGSDEVGEALAVLEAGRISRKLTLTAAEPFRFDTEAIALVDAWASRQAATELLFESLSAAEACEPIARIERETSRYADQRLYVIDLRPHDHASRFSKNTLRNIRKAEQAGAKLMSADPTVAQVAHQRLIGASLTRRAQRGESIALRGTEHRVQQLIQSGAGVVWQAGVRDEVLSSMFVYVLGPYAYYYDGGTAPEGMQLGLSHFLMARIAESLRSDGVQALNMGIASTGNDGLVRYKEGFGPALWWVERVVADRALPWRRLRAAFAGAFQAT